MMKERRTGRGIRTILVYAVLMTGTLLFFFLSVSMGTGKISW